jgi:hypothetical protein
VIGDVSWELIEPAEGKFDFTTVDAQIEQARSHSLRLVLIWFGSWKNTGSNYVPIWVKTDTARFKWAQQHNEPTPEHPHRGLYAVSAFSNAARDADAKAFRALMTHIKQTDPGHTVIMMQVENESGILFEARDYSPAAQAAWDGPVPTELTAYLSAHRQTLLPEVVTTWQSHGYRTTGTWSQVFGDDRNAQEIFSAWYIGSYIEAVMRAGHEVLPLPMYVNAWIVQNDKQVPGDYPSGGPVSRVMDIWRAAAPDSALFAPDIYISTFEDVCASYVRSGNPLLIPESRAIPGNLLYAISHFNALGVSPFGIDDLAATDPLGDLYRLLGGATPVLLKAQQEGRVVGIPPRSKGSFGTSFAGYNIYVSYVAAQVSQTALPGTGQSVPDVIELHKSLGGDTGYGMVIKTAPDDFYVLGKGLTLTFGVPPPGENNIVAYGFDEGYFKNGEWVTLRRLNGDEGPRGLRSISLPPDTLVFRRIRLYHHIGPGNKG